MKISGESTSFRDTGIRKRTSSSVRKPKNVSPSPIALNPTLDLKIRENNTNLDGMSIFGTNMREIEFFNDSEKTMYVTVETLNDHPVCALAPGDHAVYQWTTGYLTAPRVTISYYGEDRELTNLCRYRFVSDKCLVKVTVVR